MMRIVVAAGDLADIPGVVMAVERLGHRPVVVSSPVDAVKCIRRNESSALLLGPGVEGADPPGFARAFRELAAGLPVTVLSLVQPESVPNPSDLAEAGIDEVLRLPVDVNELGIRLSALRRPLDLQRRCDRHAEKMRDLREELETQNTQLAEAVAFMETANHRFAELFAGLPIACFTYDAESRIHEWNRASEALYGVGAVEAFLKPISEVISCLADGGTGWDFAQSVFSGESVEGSERIVLLPGGRECYVLYSVFPLRRPDGLIVGAICAGVDISARKAAEAQVREQMSRINHYSAELEVQKLRLEKANSRLEALTVTDCLTGVGNHRAFRETLEAEYQRAVRYGRSLSLLLLDVDRFKEYNDTFGHPAGDAALQAVGRTLSDGARVGDSVARYGGEEFAVILPDTDATRAMVAAERHRAAIAAHPFAGRQVTVSIGAATLSLSTPTRDALIGQADSALYAAKSAGRNRTAHYSDLPAGIATIASDRLQRPIQHSSCVKR